ncbi:DUF2855 family protein [Luminiphilus sp.]|nr:DUF2855 family protein [Luminiphilus sp.]
MQRFEVNRQAFSEWRSAPQAKPVLANGEVRLAIDFFAFTANNLTYAVAGDFLGYWNFFPVVPDDGYGVIPVWGFADVIESRCDEVLVGERLYGYFQPSGELVIAPINVSGGMLIDGTEHRQSLPPLYNQYQRVAKGQGEGLTGRFQALLGPLYMTGYAIADQLAVNHYYDAKQVTIVSASSKTSIGLAEALFEDDKSPKVVGLTSLQNVAFVESLGIYDQVVAYDAVDSLSQVATVVVDMAGNGATAQQLRSHFGDSLNYYISVGLTHWDKAAGSSGAPQERHEMFFAPTYIIERTKALGPGEFNRRLQGFLERASAKAVTWLQLNEVDSVEALGALYTDVCAGIMDPSEGIICKFSSH